MGLLPEEANGDGSPFYAYAYVPFSSTNDIAGDVHLNPSHDNSSTPNGFQGGEGTHGFETLIHETLHALGLKHPGNYNGSGTGRGPFLPYGEDNNTNTVMSYNFAGNSASTLMPFDIKALQYLYGARSHNASNTTYTFDTVSGFFDGSRNWGSTTAPTKATIWDTNGIDSLDFSRLAFESSGYRFDMKEGGMLTTERAYNGTSYQAEGDNSGNRYNTTTNGTAIAFGVTIENLFATNSDDRVFGNDANNTIEGNGGNDTLTGAAGDDTLVGGAGADVLEDGNGADLFKYFSVSESTPTSRDTVNLDTGFDKIDLSAIDSNLNLAGNQAFEFIGTAAFDGLGAQVRYDAVNNLIQAEIHGDGNTTVDLEIKSSESFSTLAASDFIL